MEAILLLRDTLEVPLLNGFTTTCKIITVDTIPCTCLHGQENAIICHDDIWIVGITCLTCLLLSLIISGMLLYFRHNSLPNNTKERESPNDRIKNQQEHQLVIEAEKEKARYRERLANFLEARAKGINKDEKNDFIYDNDYSEYYVKVLKGLINELKPSDDSFPKKEKE